MDASNSLISLAEAAELLGVHYMTAYRYVRTGRLPAHKDGQEWRVDRAAVDALLGAGVDVVEVGRGRRRDRSGELVDRLIRSDEAGAWSIVEEAVAGGMDPDHVYLDLLGPALAEVGDRWARGEVTVAQEHQASALVLRVIGRLGPRFARRGRKRGTVLVGAPQGDVHGLPSAFLSDILRGRRYEVVDLGGDVPADSWASTCLGLERLVAIGLCASTPGNDAGISATVAAVRSATSAPILLGGNGIVDRDHALRLGATAFSDSFASAVLRIEEQVELADADRRPGTPRSAS